MVVPTVTVITATGTYTRPVGSKYIKAFVIGGGGGGGAGGTTGRGSGGGAGQVTFRFFDETGTYNATIGTGGSSGTNGNTTTFSNGANSLQAGGGTTGTIGSSTNQSGGNTPITNTNERLFATSGFCATSLSSGNGGSNMFGSGGRGAINTADTPGGAGVGFGGGGGGGTLASNGGSGSAGAVIIFEYY